MFTLQNFARKGFSLDPVHSCRCVNKLQIDGLVQERRNSSALAMELRLSCTNPSTYTERLFVPSSAHLGIMLQIYQFQPH